MKKTGKILCTLCLIFVVAFLAIGCSVPDSGSEYVYYYGKIDGKLDKNDWIAIGVDYWQYYDGKAGVLESQGGKMLLYDGTKTQLLGTAKKVGSGLLVESNGKKKTFYTEVEIKPDENELVNKVFLLAKEKGYNNELSVLKDALTKENCYEIVLEKGYIGTETDWLQTLTESARDVLPTIKNGLWMVGEWNTGIKACGEDGKGIKKVIKLPQENGDIEYRFVYTDGDTYGFTIHDGKDGVSITKIEKIGTHGLKDTYQISMSDGSFYTFDVTNGKDANYDLTVQELYTFMQENGYTGSYLEFAKLVVGFGNEVPIDKMLRSTVSIIVQNADEPNTIDKPVLVGSGIIYSLDKNTGDAIIVTNYHVVYDARKQDASNIFNDIKVYIYGSEVTAIPGLKCQEMGIPAKFVGGSVKNDIAVLSVKGSEFLKNSIATPAEFADSDKLKVRQPITAVGNASGDGIAASEGVISVPGENVAMSDIVTHEPVSRRVVRITAPINPGNSGGGAFDNNGRVVGITNAKLVDFTTDAVGYAIPSNLVVGVTENILTQYKNDNTKPHLFKRPYIGLAINLHSSKAIIDENGEIKKVAEIIVNSITPGSPCDGKFLPDDVILSIKKEDGTIFEVNDMNILGDAIMFAKANEKIVFSVKRNGEIIDVEVVVPESVILEE